ncbi:hypothetical protein [Thomasclavelia cocleata]|uniref:Uncharacterized protein n=1 Tax=Thomasclavelia cocleata TaxID=69824 RepID=A0A829Z8J7_9FIRM|nr:hypothetical protein [Thomasclavelia cocleata]MCI9130680.1 hypothetical protein [Thomasclavelia cocleata]MCI9629878.1 hypothetical protein [Thomasclavelia cocleata]GFI40305.1 hypothetical protein IMSAGC017_00337 [Thomasclavelia cocleata]
MIKKPLKLTKNALMLIGVIILILIVFIVLKFGTGDIKKEPEDVNKETLSSLVLENQVLKVELLDFISSKNYDEKYQEVSMHIKEKEEIRGYKIAGDQEFNKVMQLLPPGKQSPLLNNSSEMPTHEAYILVLIGDIAQYKNSQGEDVYRIINARLNYYKQSLLLENDYDSVYIASIDGKKEKMVKIEEYKQVLSNPDEYMLMLQW